MKSMWLKILVIIDKVRMKYNDLGVGVSGIADKFNRKNSFYWDLLSINKGL